MEGGTLRKGERERERERGQFHECIYRSIERAAQHEAKRTEQKARGELDRQKLQNEQVCL